MTPGAKKEIMPASWCGEGAELNFGGLNVKGPKHYTKWPTRVYGDYTQLLPMEKWVGHY